MKAKILLTLFVSFLLAISLTQALTISTNASSNTITLTPQANSAVVNVSSTNFSNFTIGSISGVTISNLTSTQNVQSVLYSFSASSIASGTTSSTVPITAVNALNSSENASLTFTVVRTNNTNTLCSGSNIGNLDLEIGDINVVKGFGDDEDYWYPFDEVEIEFDVEVRGSYDIENIEITALLYDKSTGDIILDEDDMDISDDKFDLDKGDDDTFTLTFQVPAEDLEPGNNDYVLLIAATGEIKSKDTNDGKETCISDSEEIEIRTDEEFVVLDDVEFSEEAVCGGTVSLSGEVWNIGEDDLEEISISIYNKELGLDREIEVGDIDSMENEGFNLEFLVPNGITEKSYNILIEVYDEDNDLFENEEDDKSTFTYALKVTNCKAVPPAVSITAELSDETPTARVGKQVNVESTIKNTGTTQTTYTIDVSGISDWATLREIDPKSITLNAGESKKVVVYLDVNSDAATGDKEFSIRVSSQAGGVAEQKVMLSVEKGISGAKIIEHLRANWIIYLIVLVNLILIIAIILVIRRIVSK
jgi:hypothetical protein